MTCNFSSILAILRQYAKQQYVRNQGYLVDALFSSYVCHHRPSGFDSASVSRWLSGVPVPAAIADYYDSKKTLLQSDILHEILPTLSDADAAIHALCALVMSDTSLTAQQQILLAGGPFETAESQAQMLATLVSFAICRPRQYHYKK